MTSADELLAVIEAIYAAGLDAELWPQALAGVMRTIGGAAATLEVFGRQPLRLEQFHSFGVPPPHELKYLDHFSALNPRIPAFVNSKPGDLFFDYMALDEQAMDRNAFYADFLAPVGLRYCIGGMIVAEKREAAFFSVQRTTAQGHVDRTEAKLLGRLVPHVRQAFDMTRRLRGTADARHSLERALDWLADGVMLVRTDGTVVYANEAFQSIARRNDGVRTKKGIVELAAADARSRFEAALKAVHQLRSGDPRHASADFPVARTSGAPPYLVSVRPIPSNRRDSRLETAADAIVFIRDPLSRNTAAIRLLREVFGLTDAEASLAQALQSGISPGDYARVRAVSLNTVYTHLRRIKEKTGCTRMAELTRKLNDLQVPLRIE
jgi:DNA-binding CsgD family transcriptional regulator/PAS domain-containing protein